MPEIPKECPGCGAFVTHPTSTVNGSAYYKCGSWWAFDAKNPRRSPLCLANEKIARLEEEIKQLKS